MRKITSLLAAGAILGAGASVAAPGGTVLAVARPAPTQILVGHVLDHSGGPDIFYHA